MAVLGAMGSMTGTSVSAAFPPFICFSGMSLYWQNPVLHQALI